MEKEDLKKDKLSPLVGLVVSVGGSGWLGDWEIGRLGGWAADGGALLPTNRRQLAATIKRFTM